MINDVIFIVNLADRIIARPLLWCIYFAAYSFGNVSDLKKERNF